MRLLRPPSLALSLALALAALGSLPAGAQDWGNYGGNAARNGQSAAVGPGFADVLWSNTQDFSIISWHPFVLGDRVFTVRESGFPTSGGAANDAVVAYDLDTGGELWRVTLPFGGNTSLEWIAWIGGVRDGRVYTSRSSNNQPTPMRAYDAATGGFLWASAASTQAWAHDGVVFAPDGDLIVGDRLQVVRIESTDGSTVWSVPRSCPVSGNCGAAATDTALFIDQPAPGGMVLTKLDLATGATLYSSTLMAGFTDQNSPFLSPDGTTVYFSRTQNNTAVDFLFAFRDDGSSLTELWNRPVRWTTSHEHGIGLGGSLYTFTPADEFVRLDPLTGAITASAGVLSPLGGPNLSPKTVVDASGMVYVSNNWANTPANLGRLWAFSPDLTQNPFTLNLDRQNAGGPALGRDGTLVVADRLGVHAFRSPAASSYCTAGTTSNGCTPAMGAVGTASASAGVGFTVSVAGVEGQRQGILFFGLGGPKATPWGAGTSFLCVAAPTRRTGVQGSGGTVGACDGAFALDFNTWMAANPSKAPEPGHVAWMQAWFRDPPAPRTTNLSNALRFKVGP